MSAGNLPEDLMIEIFLKLPAKSLIRFRNKYYSRWFKSFTTDTFDVCLDYKLPSQGDPQFTCIVDCCNGIVCSYDAADRILFYNPSTNEHKIMRLSNKGICNNLRAFGFGYDSINDYYKIVRVYYYNESQQAEVYTLGTDSFWRKVGLPDDILPYYFFPPSDGQPFVSGAIHWLGSFRHVISFDFSSEVFHLFSLPDCVALAEGHYCLKLDVYGGLLSAIKHIVTQQDTYCYEIWVMEKHLWSKQQVIKLSLRLEYPELVGFGMNGKLILTSTTETILYDTNNGEFKKIELHDEQHRNWFYYVTYTESLVSLKGIFND
ncbi:hypothetical protein PTKIN_Ptkin13bG0122500 [Pterospermum kingtungense]